MTFGIISEIDGKLCSVEMIRETELSDVRSFAGAKGQVLLKQNSKFAQAKSTSFPCTPSMTDSLDTGSKTKKEKIREDSRYKANIGDDLESEFEKFWAAYPKRPGNPRKPAMQKFMLVRKNGATFEAIMAGVTAYAEAMRGKDAEFVAMARTWLYQERWKDPQNIQSQDVKRSPVPLDLYVDDQNQEMPF